AAKAPENPARLPAHLVGGPRVPCGDEQVAVGGDVDRVDVEVVEAPPRPALDLRLVDRDVVEAPPLADQTAARQRKLLDDAADNQVAATPADAPQIPRHCLVARHESGVVRCDDELV